MADDPKDDTKGDGQWLIRLHDAQPEQSPEQLESSDQHPEISTADQAAVLGLFQTPEELDAYLKDFPRLHRLGDTSETTEASVQA